MHSPSNTPAYQRQNQRASIQQLARFFFRKKTKNNMKKTQINRKVKTTKKKLKSLQKKFLEIKSLIHVFDPFGLVHRAKKSSV